MSLYKRVMHFNKWSGFLAHPVFTVHSTFVGVAVPGPVRSLTATERGSFHVKVEWQEPIDKNGIITEYLVEYKVGKQQKRLLHGRIFPLFNHVALSLDHDRK